MHHPFAECSHVVRVDERFTEAEIRKSRAVAWRWAQALESASNASQRQSVLFDLDRFAAEQSVKIVPARGCLAYGVRRLRRWDWMLAVVSLHPSNEL